MLKKHLLQHWKRLKCKMHYTIMYSITNSTIGEAQHTGIPKRSLILVLLLLFFYCPVCLRFWFYNLPYNVTFLFSVDKIFNVAYII